MASLAIYDGFIEPYDRDLDRAKQDRLSSTGGLVSIAYWVVRSVSLGFGAIFRMLRRR